VNAPGSPIVVFLGPSLPREEASSLLDARYLPPAQFGDVYRQVGDGVRAVVLIDGVFHGRAPVWHREIICAIENGIRVYGASSMGALRAAELRPHGMVGIGTIYEWYAAGEIDGDDEVALLYADVDQRYRLLSQPLVNLRFNLREAATRGLVAPPQAAAITADLAALPFWERTTVALWDTPTCRALDPDRLAGLRAFFERDWVDLKRRDAARALEEVARREREPAPAALPAAPTAGASHHDRFRLLEREFRRDDGEPIRGRALVERVLADPARRRLVRWSLFARFFARRWSLDHDDVVSAAALAAGSPPPPSPDRLREISLTAAEHAALASRSDLWTWLVSQPAARFGLLQTLQDEALLSSLPDVGVEALRPVASRAALARALPYVAAWCERSGAAPPPEEEATLADRWRAALEHLVAQGHPSACAPFLHAVWALDRGPVHFGYATWSLASELLGELQIAGAVASLAGLLEGEST
jgi:hypothetical protein